MGGLLYLPLGVEYPKDENGNPLALLKQVNLKDIDLENWPKSGILEIFIDKEISYPKHYTVKYYEDGLEYKIEFPEIDLKNGNFDKAVVDYDFL